MILLLVDHLHGLIGIQVVIFLSNDLTENLDPFIVKLWIHIHEPVESNDVEESIRVVLDDLLDLVHHGAGNP